MEPIRIVVRSRRPWSTRVLGGISPIEEVCGMPMGGTEVGVSSFGADAVQVFGLKRAELLVDRVDRIYWYSVFDPPPTWEATTRHKESEGSAYCRHFYPELERYVSARPAHTAGDRL